jgi:hypothetical protein
MTQQQLVEAIKAHISKGDKAAEKSEQHYIAAGQHLKTLKAEHGGTWAEWESLLKTKIGIGKSRASELMQIADGRKTVDQTRAADAAKHKRLRARRAADAARNAPPEIVKDILERDKAEVRRLYRNARSGAGRRCGAWFSGTSRRRQRWPRTNRRASAQVPTQAS